MAILLDGHVHIQPGFDLDQFLDQAWLNFSQVSRVMLPGDEDCTFVLLLTEADGYDFFSSLALDAENGYSRSEKKWQFHETLEHNSLFATNREQRILLIAGRQLISSENIELLSLFCPRVIEDRSRSLAELARQVSNEGAIPLLPWGVGKWLGRRGKAVQAFLDSPPVPFFLVGDSGNRPRIWGYPRLLARAEQQGVGALAGSDPLRFSSHVSRAGSRGGFVHGQLNREQPARLLQEILVSKAEIISFGTGVGTVQFIRDQLQANLRKRT